MNASDERRDLLLGIDVGTTRIKAVAIDDTGAGRAEASVPTPFAASKGGVEMEVADLGRAIAAVIAALGLARDRIVAVGLAGMAESGAALRAGLATGPIIAWHDGRGEETVASLEQRFGPQLARWTGRRVRTVSSVAKLGWLLDHGLDPPGRWLGVPELALFLLTGAEATEHSLAARTGAYHVTERRWLPEVIGHVTGATGEHRGRQSGREVAPGGGPERFTHRNGGLSAQAGRVDGLFPPVRAAGTVMGRVQEDAGAALGLSAGIPVTIAGHDHLAAAAGLGAEPDDLFNSVGTAETLVRRLDAAPDVDRALELELAVTVWPGGDAWGVLASVTRSGLVIEALSAHLGLDAGALDAPAVTAPGDGDESGADLVPLGQGVEVHSGAPAAMWAETVRALAGRTAGAAERVAALAGPHRRLVVFGGGSRSDGWLRAKAEEVGVPAVRCSVAEAAARGAALAAGVAAGWWPTVAAGPPPPLEPLGGPPGTMEP